MLSVEHYDAIADLMQTEQNPSRCWKALLDLTGQSSVEMLRRVEVEGDISGVADQLRYVWS